MGSFIVAGSCCCGGVPTNCCPDNSIPSTLFLTIGAPGCGVDGLTVTLVYDSVQQAWIGNSASPCPVQWTFVCYFDVIFNAWKFRLSTICSGGGDPCIISGANDSFLDSCIPFFWEETATGFSCGDAPCVLCNCSNGNMTFTVQP